MLNPFVVRIHKRDYRIETVCDADSIMHEVFTDTEKLFSLEMGADANWKTVEPEVMLADQALIAEIGDAIMKHYTF